MVVYSIASIVLSWVISGWIVRRSRKWLGLVIAIAALGAVFLIVGVAVTGIEATRDPTEDDAAGTGASAALFGVLAGLIAAWRAHAKTFKDDGAPAATKHPGLDVGKVDEITDLDGAKKMILDLMDDVSKLDTGLARARVRNDDLEKQIRSSAADVDPDPEAREFAERLKGITTTIEYTDSNGNNTRRQITCQSTTDDGVIAFCHSRRAVREFKVPRIKCFITESGEIIDPKDFFNEPKG